MRGEWHYSPYNLGHWKYDTIRFGGLTDATSLLADMRNQVTEYGMVWMERLTPAEALNQLKQNGEGAYCEKIWIEDYELFLSQSNVRSGLPIR